MENQQFVRFDKNMTAIIKGIAIIMMICLHCYSFGQDAYDVPLNFDYSLDKLGLGFNLCIGIYAFMVGYGYAFSKTKDMKYGLQHIKKLLISYWVILFVFSLPVSFAEVKNQGVGVFVLTLFGIDPQFIHFNWFVFFYIILMALFPLIARLIDRKPVLFTAVIVISIYVLEVLYHTFIFDSIPENRALLIYTCFRYLPIAVLGYLFAHERYYERIRIDRLSPLVALVMSVLVFLVVLKISSFALFKGFQLDFFYAPLFIGAIVTFFNKFKLNPLRRLLGKFGDLSVYMWFFHAIFFTETIKWLYQPAITIFKDINLVVLWTIVLTFFASWLIKTVVDACQRWLSKLVTRTA